MSGQKIIVGVTGGVACYKAANLVSALTQQNFNVQVVMTDNAAKFVTPITFRALSRNPVCTEEFASGTDPVPHISLVEDAVLYIVAPATANTIAKLANGLADNLLTTSFLAARCPKLIVPAMNTAMWENSLTQENIQKLKKHGISIMEPAVGHLACGTTGAGRYPDNQAVLLQVKEILRPTQKLSGKKIIITGGGTREPLDPVRVISNTSSGKMGLALKAAAESAGAQVVYIDASTCDAAALKEKIAEEFTSADTLIMAAAVSDYRPAKVSKNKIKSDKSKLTVALEKNEDLLKYFAQRKKKQYIVGFALESVDLLKNAQAKLKNKNLDLLVANEVLALGSDRTKITLLDKQNNIETLDEMTKIKAAEKIIERICRSLR